MFQTNDLNQKRTMAFQYWPVTFCFQSQPIKISPEKWNMVNNWITDFYEFVAEIKFLTSEPFDNFSAEKMGLKKKIKMIFESVLMTLCYETMILIKRRFNVIAQNTIFI